MKAWYHWVQHQDLNEFKWEGDFTSNEVISEIVLHLAQLWHLIWWADRPGDRSAKTWVLPVLGLSPVFAWPWCHDTGAGIGATLCVFKLMQAFSTVANVFFRCWKMQPVISAAVFLKGLAAITRCLSKSVSWRQSVLLALPLQPNFPNVVIPKLSKAYLRDYRVYRKVILNFTELWSSLPLCCCLKVLHSTFEPAGIVCLSTNSCSELLLPATSHQTSGLLFSSKDHTCHFSQFLSLDAAAEP